MKICIVRHGEIGLTETFIRAHAERLPGDVTMTCGVPPRFAGDSGSGPGLPRQLMHRALHVIRGRPEHEEHSGTYRALLSRVRPDVVLAEYGPSAVRVLGAVRSLGIPLVAHFHGYDASAQKAIKRYGNAYKKVFEYASAVVGVSRVQREALIGLGANPDRVYHNPCGVDVEAFVPGNPAKAPPVFLSVGRLVDKKAPHLLILAFAEAHRQIPEAKLRIIGDGDLMGVCSDLVSALGLEGAIELLGSQPHDVVRREMSRSRAFVQHSVVAESGDSEGTPVAVMEAGAAGLPVIATRHAGIPDVVEEGRTGFLVEERDVAAMSRAMVRISGDPALTRSMGFQARERVAEYFSMDRSIQRLWEIIRAAVAAPAVDTPQAGSDVAALEPVGVATS